MTAAQLPRKITANLSFIRVWAISVYVFTFLRLCLPKSIQTLKEAAFTFKGVCQKASLMVKDSCLAITVSGYFKDWKWVFWEASQRHRWVLRDAFPQRRKNVYDSALHSFETSALTYWSVFMDEMRAGRSASLSVLPWLAQHEERAPFFSMKTRGFQITTQVKSRNWGMQKIARERNTEERKGWSC